MANFDLLKIKNVKYTELDSAIKSKSDNGLVKTRIPYTKIRKVFTLKPVTYSTFEEFSELKNLWDAVRDVTAFVWNHPTEKDAYSNPKQSTVRFRDKIEWEQDASTNNFYQISEFTLEEV